jgi:hypothetical protein
MSNITGDLVIVDEGSHTGLTVEDFAKGVLKTCNNCLTTMQPKEELMICKACMVVRPENLWGCYCLKCRDKDQVCRVHPDSKYKKAFNGDGSVIPQMIQRNEIIALHLSDRDNCECGNGVCKPLKIEELKLSDT